MRVIEGDVYAGDYGAKLTAAHDAGLPESSSSASGEAKANKGVKNLRRKDDWRNKNEPKVDFAEYK